MPRRELAGAGSVWSPPARVASIGAGAGAIPGIRVAVVMPRPVLIGSSLVAATLFKVEGGKRGGASRVVATG
ncbi:MAG: hypothetical protein OZSIB_0796 [Candidatus Ozemobacter sibiricus]|uniref:Uncharacterized protein n=1 Tax=Candidatus Ozemobacter sibiricus TaxID=2268124 RepID=A0A367ZWD1_9BACT|nr:MAG: hypothetical protein OZSIB_0796 [Candidatus Ozemobacter sibiricus]